MDFIKQKLSTPEGWCAAIIFITKAVEYFTPDSIDAQIDQIATHLTALIIAGSAIFVGIRAGNKTV